MYRTETDLSHLSNAVRAFVGIGTVFKSRTCCRDFIGPSPSISLDKKVILVFNFWLKKNVSLIICVKNEMSTINLKKFRLIIIRRLLKYRKTQ